MRKTFAAAALCMLLAALPASAGAQVFTGRIDATVVDSTGAVLPGVTVAISGPQNQETVTDAQGEAHFLNLAPGTYQVKASLSGFADYLNREVPVGAGAGVPLRVQLGVAGVSEQVNVAGDTPVIDAKRSAIATNVTYDEMQNIPTSRDPWVVLQTVPSIVVDRVNVGGAESGQQSNYIGKGADGGDNTWYIDGIPITDMTALGSSPTYYDFDMFQEMQVSTGGADVLATTPGVQLNFVLKQGSNTAHGSSRVFFANEDLQSNNLPSELLAVAGDTGKGNRTDQYADYGAELGGPIMRDKLWAWGSWGKTDVRIRTINDVLDRTILENTAFKGTAQFNTDTRGGFTFFSGNKKKDGRGAGPFNPPETTLDQDGPTKTYKGEVSYVAGTNLFLTARGAYIDAPFTLEPKGGRDTQVFLDADNVFHNSYYYLNTNRPQRTVMLDGNWFRGRHEVKFGASWRAVKDETDFNWGGGVLNVELDRESRLVLPVLYRPYTQNNRANYLGAYVGDTISLDRLTANVAVRLDRTTSSTLETVVRPHPLVPDILPGFTAPPVDDVITWNAVSPRIGLSYALTQNRKTVARLSYASFASQLNVTDPGLASAASYAYAYYLAVDENNNLRTEVDEILFSRGSLGAKGVDLDHPDSLTSVNVIDADLRAPRTHEIVVGLDHEIMPNVGVTGSFTWRRFNNTLWPSLYRPLVGTTRADYTQSGAVTGTLAEIGTFNVPYYALNEDAVPAGGGVELENRPGYHRAFRGVEVSATKRLANRWMARLGFSWNQEKEYFDDPAQGMHDPTPTQISGPLVDGGTVMRATTGSGKSQIFLIVPRYQLVANGFWQGPWGLSFGGNLLTREGFGKAYYANDTETDDPITALKDVLLVSDLDEQRLPRVTTLDLRVEKGFTFGRYKVLFDADMFNVANSATVLGRQYNINATGIRGFNNVLEIMNPRILRFGVRLNF
jgi:hypothetical protein